MEKTPLLLPTSLLLSLKILRPSNSSNSATTQTLYYFYQSLSFNYSLRTSVTCRSKVQVCFLNQSHFLGNL